MKAFSFRLEKLLKVKERIEGVKLQAHEESRLRVEEQDNRLAALESERSEHTREERKLLSGALNVVRLRAFSRYFHHLHNESKAGRELRSALEKERLDKRAELVKASRERKGLTEYREKLRLRHQKEVDKEESAEADESSTQRFIFERRQRQLRQQS